MLLQKDVDVISAIGIKVDALEKFEYFDLSRITLNYVMSFSAGFFFGMAFREDMNVLAITSSAFGGFAGLVRSKYHHDVHNTRTQLAEIIEITLERESIRPMTDTAKQTYVAQLARIDQQLMNERSMRDAADIVVALPEAGTMASLGYVAGMYARKGLDNLF